MNLIPPNFENSFTQAKILVVGDVMLDRYLSGDTKRISPEAPVPIIKVDKCEDKPGGAANVALNISALGAETILIGAVCQDEAFVSLQTILNSANVTCDFVKVSQPTIIKMRALSRNQQLLRLDFEQNLQVDEQVLVQKVSKYLNQVNLLVLSDYGKGTLKHQKLIQLANKANIPVLIDPKGNDFSIYQNATIITPNLAEFEAIVGHCNNEETLIERGLKLIADLNLKALLITRSENGMTLLRPSLPEMHIPARASEVFDVTGAGDTVISTLATALAANLPIEKAVMLANLAASIVVGKLGTATISATELCRAVAFELGSERGVLNFAQLKLVIDEAKSKHEKIVFTNGCFDILHAGHVAYLEQARKLGDRLIVAVNTDQIVTKLKGYGRPINNVERRMAVLAGLEAVDWVVPFATDTPLELITQIKPDFLVKGGDYKVSDIVGFDFVQSYGGKVLALNLVENSSTSAIVSKIRQQTLLNDQVN